MIPVAFPDVDVSDRGSGGRDQNRLRYTPASTSTFLLVPILLLFVLMIVAVVRSPNLLSSSGIGSAVIVVTPLMLATFALTPVVMAGRAGVDLSIGPLIGFINVTLVVLFKAGFLNSGFEFFLYAMAVGAAYQLLMGLIICFVRIQPIIVALSGYLVLAGLNLIILSRPGGAAPEWMMPWGLGTTIWSPVLLILAVSLAGWFLFTRTAFYDHLRLMGADERTAYSAGVNIVAVRLGAHVIAGIFAGLSAITFTSLIGSGDPTQGTTYTLLAVTALVLGGTSLGGGRGSIIGSMLGALNIYLITYVLATFNFGKVQSFVTQLSYGGVLVFALLLTLLLPRLQQLVRGLSPLAVFIVLALGVTGVALQVKDRISAPGGVSVGVGLAGDSGEGTSLAAQSGSGTSLAGQSGGGTSLAGQSLAGAGEGAEVSSTRGTVIVIAVVIIAALGGLAYLLYRYPGILTFVLAAIVALLLIGYSAYDGRGPGGVAAVARHIAVPSLFYLEGPANPSAWAASPALGSPLVAALLVMLGAVLVGSVLIFTTVTSGKRPMSDAALVAVILAVLVSMGLMVHEAGLFARGPDSIFNGAAAALIVGAALMLPTLPTFQSRDRNMMTIMFALVGMAAIGAMFFAVRSPDLVVAAGGALPPASAGPVAVGEAVLPEWFYEASWGVIIVAAIVFLLAIPSVRSHVLQDIRVERNGNRISYLGLFIAGFSILALGAVFTLGAIPLWKFAVAIIAAVIFSRVLMNFLADYKRRFGDERERSPS